MILVVKFCRWKSVSNPSHHIFAWGLWGTRTHLRYITNTFIRYTALNPFSLLYWWCPSDLHILFNAFSSGYGSWFPTRPTCQPLLSSGILIYRLSTAFSMLPIACQCIRVDSLSANIHNHFVCLGQRTSWNKPQSNTSDIYWSLLSSYLVRNILAPDKFQAVSEVVYSCFLWCQLVPFIYGSECFLGKSLADMVNLV